MNLWRTKLPNLPLTSFIMAVVLLWGGYAQGQGQWSEPVRISQPGVCRNPQILARGDTLHVVYEHMRGPDKISYLRSIDGGESWDYPRLLSDTINAELAQMPGIVKSSGNRLMATWATYNPGAVHYNIAYVFSNNHGLSWTAPAYIFEQNLENPITLCTANDGDVVNLIMGNWTGDSVGVFDIRSTNFGQTWMPRRLIFNIFGSGQRDCAAFDSVLHLAWSGRYDQDHSIEIYYTHSIDNGVNWIPSIPLSDTDRYHSQLPAIAANSVNGVAACWMDFKYAPPGFTGDIFIRQSNDSGENWEVITELISNHFAFRSDIALNVDTVYIAWEDESNGASNKSIQYTQSNDNGLTWSQPFCLDGTFDDSKYPALAFSSGCVYAAWGETRQSPDTSGLFFSRWVAEPNAVEDSGRLNGTEAISLRTHPNPFNSSVTISYWCAEGGDIKIVNTLGQVVREFAINPFGGGQLVWDGKEAAGDPAASGVFFVRLQSGWQTRTVRIIYIK